jgi:hypothetical protein
VLYRFDTSVEEPMAYKVHDAVTRKVAILRLRAERYRRLAHDLLDPRTSVEATNLADELDAEIARLQNEPDAARGETSTSMQVDFRPTIFSG